MKESLGVHSLSPSPRAWTREAWCPEPPPWLSHTPLLGLPEASLLPTLPPPISPAIAGRPRGHGVAGSKAQEAEKRQRHPGRSGGPPAAPSAPHHLPLLRSRSQGAGRSRHDCLGKRAKVRLPSPQQPKLPGQSPVLTVWGRETWGCSYGSVTTLPQLYCKSILILSIGIVTVLSYHV